MPPAKSGWLGKLNKAGSPPESLLRADSPRAEEAGTARTFTAETPSLERTLSDLVNQAYGLTPAEIALMWQTAPPRMPIRPPGRFPAPALESPLEAMGEPDFAGLARGPAALRDLRKPHAHYRGH